MSVAGGEGAARGRHPTGRDVHGEAVLPDGCPASYLYLRCAPCAFVVALDDYTDLGAHRRTRTGELVHRAKYEDDHGAARVLADWLAYWLPIMRQHRPVIDRVDVVVPIPPRLDSPRSAGRLPVLLARRAAEALGVPCDPTLLVETKPREPVKFLPVADRADVLQEQFRGETPSRGTVLLVDDMIQSGATLGAAASALRGVGADAVVGLVAAKVGPGLVAGT